MDFIPWERLPDESPQAWAGFVAYRDMGTYRSTAKAAKTVRKSKHSLDVFSRTHNWVARAAAWDAECDKIHRQELLEQQKKTVRAHADAAAVVRKHAMEAIKKIGSDLDADQAIKWLQVAVKMESVAMGIPTERTAASVEISGGKDPLTVFFDTLPPEQLLNLAREAMREVEKSTQGASTDECAANAAAGISAAGPIAAAAERQRAGPEREA